MNFLHVNFLAVLVSAVVIFLLGGLWYSKALFAKKWIALMGISEEQMKAKPSAPMPVLLIQAFICGLLISWTLAVIINHFPPYHALHGALAGAACWLGFASPPKPVSAPLLAITRWHGTTIGMGFAPFAAPTARTASG